MELRDLLSFLKRHSINQSDIAKIGQFKAPTGKYIDIKETYISRAKNDPFDNYYSPILVHLKDFFGLDSSKEENRYSFQIQDEVIFNQQVSKVTSRRKGSESGSARTEAKYNYFADTEWQLYTRTAKGIHRHQLKLLPKYQAEIKNAEQGKDYRGTWAFDETKSYLILNLSHFRTMDKALHMLFYVGRGEEPSLCLGGYINTGDTGGRVYAATAVGIMTEKAEHVKLIRWEEVEDDESTSGVPKIVAKYLAEKHLNGISTPGKGIRSIEHLEEWWEKRNQSLKDEKSLAYTGDYLVYFQDEENMKTLSLTIYETDKDIQGKLVEPGLSDAEEHNRDFGTGPISRYEKTLSFTCSNHGRPVYLQMTIGGIYTRDYECYCGIVTGLNYTDEEIVAYPIIVVKKEMLKSTDAEEKLKAIHASIRKKSESTIYAVSPKRFRINNLSS